MEIATMGSRALHLFPKDQRFKSKGTIACSSIEDASLNLEHPQRDRKVKYDEKRQQQQYSDEVNPPVKRQKKTAEVISTTTKVKSLTPSLNKAVFQSKQEANTKVTDPMDVRALLITKPEKSSITASKACNNETKDGTDLKTLIAKAQQKLHEKRHIDHQREDIARERLAARLALKQMVATAAYEDHLKYHRELLQLGCTFIHDEVDRLNMFKLLSRDFYNGVSNSVLEKSKTPWCDEDLWRKKQQRSTNGESMEHSLGLQGSQITMINGESAESSIQMQSKCQSSTSVGI